MKVAMEFDDGNRFEAEANPKTWSGVATSSAFKKQFGVPVGFLALYDDVFVQNDDEIDVDISALTPEQLTALPDPQEGMAFMAWKELLRRCEGVPNGSWDAVVEKVVDVEVDFSEDPTEAST